MLTALLETTNLFCTEGVKISHFIYISRTVVVMIRYVLLQQRKKKETLKLKFDPIISKSI